jgi:predicted deacylase
VRGVTNILKDIGTLEGEPERVHEQLARVFEENFTVATTRGGTMHPKVFPSEVITKGQVLAEIKNIEGDVVEELMAPADGVVRVLFPRRVVGTGSIVYRGWVTSAS